jgi:hypothetical protein
MRASALIAAFVLALASAYAALADRDAAAAHFPAETMTHGPFAKAASDPSAFGGKALVYEDPGTATRSVGLPSEAGRVVIRARDSGDAPEPGGPRSGVGLRVRVDGVVVGEKIVSSASYAYYPFDAGVLPEGTRKIGVEAYALDGSERAHVDAVRIVPEKGPGVPGGGGRQPAGCDVTVGTSDDLDAAIKSDPRAAATKFCLAAGTHRVSDTTILRSGDSLSGPVGKQVARGPAVYGRPTAKVVGDSVDKVLAANGSNVTIEWVDVSGGDGRINPDASASSCPSSSLPEGAGCPVVGTGVGIALGQSDGTTRVRNVRVHDNDGLGISNARGRITNSEFFSNTLDPAFLGVVGSAIKGVAEFEAAHNYVHNEQGNGIWHDHSLSGGGNDTAMSSNPGGGTWFHHNLVVDNGRWGLRFEYSPRNAAEGQHLSSPSFLAEHNLVAGNGSGGASHLDAQNGTWRSNVFGPQTVGGVAYPNNGGKRALVVSNSGRADRTDLWNVDVRANALNGETVSGCALPDAVVSCSGASPLPTPALRCWWGRGT